jgi:hypothetical protein
MTHLLVGLLAHETNDPWVLPVDVDAWPGKLGRHRVKWAKKGIRGPNRVFTFFSFLFSISKFKDSNRFKFLI